MLPPDRLELEFIASFLVAIDLVVARAVELQPRSGAN
jgi:hypothetical protein